MDLIAHFGLSILFLQNILIIRSPNFPDLPFPMQSDLSVIVLRPFVTATRATIRTSPTEAADVNYTENE